MCTLINLIQEWMVKEVWEMAGMKVHMYVYNKPSTYCQIK